MLLPLRGVPSSLQSKAQIGFVAPPASMVATGASPSADAVFEAPPSSATLDVGPASLILEAASDALLVEPLLPHAAARAARRTKRSRRGDTLDERADARP